ncbi:MAG: ABC transporter ATP-binding protein [Candidatus Aminicenantaceae bacterium]
MNSLPIIKTERLTKVYSSGKIQVVALKDVTLSIGKGRFVSVTGPSGSGKSTLLNLLGGLDTPTAGVIESQEKKISDMNKEELALYRRNKVGMIFQSFNLITYRSALENVELPLLFSGIPKGERKKKALDILERLGLYPRRNHRPPELSGGEQQRVAIARALVNSPRVLLADEPTGNLDSKTSREIIEVLVDLNENQNITVVLVSHEEALVREFSQEIFHLCDGEVVRREKIQ